MKKLFCIDACLRNGSNTKKIADAIIGKLSEKYEIETVNLSEYSFPIVKNDILDIDKNQCVHNDNIHILIFYDIKDNNYDLNNLN